MVYDVRCLRPWTCELQWERGTIGMIRTDLTIAPYRVCAMNVIV
jgi:hypothetical protein